MNCNIKLLQAPSLRLQMHYALNHFFLAAAAASAAFFASAMNEGISGGLKRSFK
jgi:hypothetical protein